MKKLVLVGLVLVFMLSAMVGCSSSSGPSKATMTAPATSQSGRPYQSYDTDEYTTNSSKGGVYTTAPTAVPQSPAGNGTWSNVVSQQSYQTINRMVVRNGNLRMVVNEIAASVDSISQIASKYGGYVVSSQKWKEGDRNIGNISIRVLAENYEPAMADLRALAKSITSETTSSQDVTEEYIDLDSKVKNLEATEAQLLKVMATATETEDIISIQRELTSVRGEIEQAKGRMQYLERTSSTSLIDINMEEAVIAVKFTAAKVSMGTNEAVQFTSEVTGGFAPYNYFWDFGDGKTSTDVSPSHSYKDAGAYSVYLKVTDDKGYTNTMTRNAYINVLASWKPSSVASGAWSGLSTFGRGLVNVLIWVGIFSPVWLVIGGIIWFFVWRTRKKAAYNKVNNVRS